MAWEDLMLLVGEWQGAGVAEFPTIERVEYDESLVVEWDAERAVLCYEQTAVLRDGTPSHRETGFIELGEDGAVRLWNVQNNGRAEILGGSGGRAPDGAVRLELSSVAFAADPRMLESTRRIVVTEGTLEYEMGMATTTAEGHGRLPHLRARLERRS